MISSDLLLERGMLKRQVLRWRSFGLLAFLVLVALLVSEKKSTRTLYEAKPYIARVYIEEIILDDKERLEKISDIADDGKVKAVVLHINSPGGTIVASEALYKSLLCLSSKKPLAVVMRDVAASGGYMISLAADRVFAYKGTITGSIGVVMQSAEFVDLANKLGIQFSSFKSSPLKAAPNTFEKVTPEIREALQSVIDDSYQTFFDLVSERRKIQPSVLKQIADGRIYTGNQAVKLNLIDEIGDEDSAIEWLQKNKGIDKSVDIVDIDLVQTPNKLESLLDKATSFLHYFTVLLFNRQVLY